MLKQHEERGVGSSIINMASVAGSIRGLPNRFVYGTSKAAVIGLTKAIAADYVQKGVRCNAIQMGYMDTPMAVSGIATATGRPTAEVRAERDARVPLGGKMGTGWDTAYAALFLASDEAKFISGAILPVDGAMGVRIG